MISTNKMRVGGTVILLSCLLPLISFSQTEQDALMMPKKILCVAANYSYNSWGNYWEGSFKRDNQNIGTLSTQAVGLMFNYGISNNLNILGSLPYMSIKANQGTLQGLNGFQDAGLFIKWKPINKIKGSNKFSLFGVAGYSTPSNDYNVDFMPMCIGLGSNVLSGRLIADVQHKKLFATLSAAYQHRSNVEIDREAYYTTRQINSSEVRMPNAGNFQMLAGYRTKTLIAEAFLDNMTTFGGFDIRKNDMPFVSNKMNSTKIGAEAKYYIPKHTSLGFHANVWHTIAGRNVGQATGFMTGIDYAFKIK